MSDTKLSEEQIERVDVGDLLMRLMAPCDKCPNCARDRDKAGRVLQALLDERGQLIQERDEAREALRLTIESGVSAMQLAESVRPVTESGKGETNSISDRGSAQ